MESSALSSPGTSPQDVWLSSLVLVAACAAAAVLWHTDFFGGVLRFFVLFKVPDTPGIQFNKNCFNRFRVHHLRNLC